MLAGVLQPQKTICFPTYPELRSLQNILHYMFLQQCFTALHLWEAGKWYWFSKNLIHLPCRNERGAHLLPFCREKPEMQPAKSWEIPGTVVFSERFCILDRFQQHVSIFSRVSRAGDDLLTSSGPSFFLVLIPAKAVNKT